MKKNNKSSDKNTHGKEKYTPPGYGWERVGTHYGYRRKRAMGKFEYWYPSVTCAFKARAFHHKKVNKFSGDPTMEDFHNDIYNGAGKFLSKREREDSGVLNLIRKLELKENLKSCEKKIKKSIEEYGKTNFNTKKAKEALKTLAAELKECQ